MKSLGNYILKFTLFIVLLIPTSAWGQTQLLTNRGAEDASTSGDEILEGDWINSTGGDFDEVSQSKDFTPVAQSGNMMFYQYKQNNEDTYLEQKADVSGWAGSIDGGDATVDFSGWLHTTSLDNDNGRFTVEFLDGSNSVVDSFDSGFLESDGAWQEVNDSRPVPSGTRSIRLRLHSRDGPSGSGDAIFHNVYFDNTSLTIQDANAGPTTIFVNADASFGGDGSSWNDAYRYLQDALDDATGSDEIWIAEGTYYPDDGANVSQGDPDASFTITGHQNGLKIYGGFAGDETQLNQRDISSHRTILSGDIDDNDTKTNGVTMNADDINGTNSNHVLFLDAGDVYQGGNDVDPNITTGTQLNSLVITGGQANGSSSFDKNGGGLYCDGLGSGNECSPTLRNIIFTGNNALRQGGAIYNNGVVGTSSPVIANTIFSGNQGSYGGVIANNGDTSGTSNPTITNVIFTNNSAENGGVLFNTASNPTITNTIFYSNTASKNGNQIANDQATPTISHSLIEGSGGSSNWDTSLGNNNGGNIDINPQFVDATNPTGADGTWFTADDGLQLYSASPAVNAGDNDAIPSGITTDIAGNARIQNTTVNMGAYESTVTNNPPAFTSSSSATVSENSTGMVLDVNANDGDGGGDDVDINYNFTGGADAPLFRINSTTGELSLDIPSDFENPNDNNADNDYELVVTASDGVHTTDQNITITVTDVNEPPELSNLDGDNKNVSPGGAAARIDAGSDATVTNIDSPDYNGGFIRITDNNANNTANGNFSVDGTNVISGGDGTISAGETIAIGGTAVGTIHATNDGQGGNDLEINFTTTDASSARIQTLIRNLRWGAATGSGAQTFMLTLNDGDGTANGGDQDDTANFTMTLGNPPVIGNLDGDTVDFLEEGPPVTLDALASATLMDADNPASLNGGNMTATVSAGAMASEDLLKLNTYGAVSLSGTTSGSTINVNGTAVGTLANDITTGNDLRVNFNSNATLPRVELLLQALQYSSSVSPLTENSRRVQVIVTDNRGMPSAPSTITVNTVVDQSPTVSNAITDISVDENAANDTYDLTDVFSDPEDNDGDLTFSVQGNDNSSVVDVSVDNSTNQLTLDYQMYQTGTANITVRAEDSRGQTVDDSFTVTVNSVPQIIFVDADATGSNNGSSWDNAFTNLQDALAAADGEDQIWIAEGTYYPDEGDSVTKGDREASFTITGSQDGIEIYGGFSGTESNVSERDIGSHRVILNGDIGTPNDKSDNSYNVIFIDGTTDNGITKNTIINGLTVTNGHANGNFTDFYNVTGAGLHCDGSTNGKCNLTLANIAFMDNEAVEGGAMYNFGNGQSNPRVINVLFYNNKATRGGAIFNRGRISGSDASPTILNTIFYKNKASDDGGAILNYGPNNPSIENSILYDNTAKNEGNHIRNTYSAAPAINHSLIEGSGGSSNWNSDLGTDGGGNIDVNPQFVDVSNPAGPDGKWFTDDDGLVLQPTSPAVDAGDNDAIPSEITTDIAGNQRTRGGTVDMGAYESESDNPPTVANPIADITVDEDAASDTYDLTDVFSDNEDNDADLTFSIQNNDNSSLVDATVDNSSDQLTIDYQSNQSGTANITVRAKDSSDETVDDNFEVTVNPVNDAPWISSIKNQSLTAGQTAGPISFTIEDIDNDLADLSLSAISDNQAVLPDQNILLSGSGSDRSVTLKTEENTSGNAVIEIVVDDGALSDTTSFELSITANAPKQVTLKAPENKSTDQSLRPNFTWDTAAEAETYEFQLADDTSFTDENIIAEQSDISGTELEISEKLNRETAYYWRVRGTNTGGKGEWSSKYQFTTIPALPARVTLKAPANKKSGVNTQPIFSWETVNNADTYEWQLSKDENFDSLINEATLSDNNLQPNDELAHNTSYYWRVRALNSGGKGDWSPKQRLTTEASPPALSFPSDNETGISIAPRLAWSSDYENSRFRVKLSGDQQLQNIILDTLVTSETVKVSGLQPNTDYFWQVRVEAEENNSAPSPISNFTTRMPTESEMVDTKITFGQSGNSDLQSYDYRLMSLPGNESHPIDEFFNGEYGTDWKAFEDNGDEENFLQEYSDDHPLSFTSGKGYWVLSKKAVRVEDEISAVDISEDDTYILELEPGWNIIGNPFNRPASWQDIQAFNNRSLILYEYEGSFSKSKQMDPFKGYYVYNDSTAVLNLEIPYTSLQKMRSKDRNTSKEKGANRKIRLKINQLKDDITSQVEINYPSQTGSSIKQKQDHYLPPLRLSKFGAGIINEEHEHRQKMMHTINSHFDEKRNKYTIELKTESRSEVVWKPEIEGMNSQTAVLIVEPQNGRTKILGDGESYPFMAKIGHQRFTVYTGSLSDLKEIEKSLVPQQITLNPNYPNPFNSTTTIQIGIDQQSEVTLEVFNILGQKVRTLVNESMQAGWHKVIFDGSRLASGTYFYRLIVGEQIQTKKMVLIK